MDNDFSKAVWEKQAAEVFINWYNFNHPKHLKFLSNNRPFKQIWIIGDLQAKSGALSLYE